MGCSYYSSENLWYRWKLMSTNLNDQVHTNVLCWIKHFIYYKDETVNSCSSKAYVFNSAMIEFHNLQVIK